MIPTFLICGAQKSGTTSLYKTLGQHPKICLASNKEIHFFDREKNFRKGKKWYKEFFSHCNQSLHVHICEATPHYYRNEKAAKRIAHFADVKIIFILRDPVDRAYSNYWHNKQRGSEIRKFSDAIKSEDGIKKYIKKGLYYKHIKAYYRYFEKEKVKIVTFEDFVERKGVLKEIFEFLELEYVDVEIATGNKTRAPSSYLSTLLRYYYKKVSPWVPKYLQTTTKGIRRAVKMYTESEGYKKIDKKVRREIEPWFLEDIKKIHKNIDVDISSWKTYKRNLA